jgi:hypothetical protein
VQAFSSQKHWQSQWHPAIRLGIYGTIMAGAFKQTRFWFVSFNRHIGDFVHGCPLTQQLSCPPELRGITRSINGTKPKRKTVRLTGGSAAAPLLGVRYIAQKTPAKSPRTPMETGVVLSARRRPNQTWPSLGQTTPSDRALLRLGVLAVCYLQFGHQQQIQNAVTFVGLKHNHGAARR